MINLNGIPEDIISDCKYFRCYNSAGKEIYYQTHRDYTLTKKYDNYGNIIESRDSAGLQYDALYDDNNRLVKTVTDGVVCEWVYDDNGKLVSFYNGHDSVKSINNSDILY